jgi:hypothetical protein
MRCVGAERDWYIEKVLFNLMLRNERICAAIKESKLLSSFCGTQSYFGSRRMYSTRLIEMVHKYGPQTSCACIRIYDDYVEVAATLVTSPP